MEVEQIILGLMVPCIGALATVVTVLWRNQNTATAGSIQELKDEIADLQNDVKALRQNERDLQRQIHTLQTEKAQLYTQFLLLQTSHESSPLPMWIKDETGRILGANEAYEKHYLRPLGKKLHDWIGNFDHDVFPADVAEDWRVNDMWVFQHDQIFDGEEIIDLGDGKRTRHRVIKHPRRAHGIPRPFGIAGISIPDEL